MPKTMKQNMQELLTKIPKDTISFGELVKEISLNIGGDNRTQKKYLQYCEELGIITPDEKDLAVMHINRDVLKDE